MFYPLLASAKFIVNMMNAVQPKTPDAVMQASSLRSQPSPSSPPSTLPPTLCWSHFSSISFFATLSSFSITSFPFISTCSQFLVSPIHSPQNPPPFLPPPSPSNSSSSTICSLCKTQMTFYLLPSTLQLSTEV